MVWLDLLQHELDIGCMESEDEGDATDWTGPATRIPTDSETSASMTAFVDVTAAEQERLRDFIRKSGKRAYIRDAWLSSQQINGHTDPMTDEEEEQEVDDSSDRPTAANGTRSPQQQQSSEKEYKEASKMVEEKKVAADIQETEDEDDWQWLKLS